MFIDRLIGDLKNGRHERAFQNIDPQSGPFDVMLFNENFNLDEPHWSVYPRRDILLNCFITEWQIENDGVKIKVPKEKRKELKEAYFIAVGREVERYKELARKAHS